MTHVETERCHNCAATYRMDELLSSRVRGELLCHACASQTGRGISREQERERRERDRYLDALRAIADGRFETAGEMQDVARMAIDLHDADYRIPSKLAGENER